MKYGRDGIEPSSPQAFSLRQIVGFPLGILLCVLVLLTPSPEGLSPQAQRAAAVAILMATWWISECLPIAVTALVPLVAYPFLNIIDMNLTASQYGNSTIFLMMGGFLIAISMQRWNLHKRLALMLVSKTGTNPPYLLGGFMVASAFLSMWISNTATVVMLLPIAMAVLSQLRGLDNKLGKISFPEALMLGIAYAASIGGIATLIGSPPNMIFVGQVKALFPDLPDISFVTWFIFALPLACLFLLIVWGYLALRSHAWRYSDEGGDGDLLLRKELESLGPWARGEKAVIIVFVATAFAWLTRSDLQVGSYTINGWSSILNVPSVTDGTVAMTAGIALFAIPLDLKKGVFVLSWNSAKNLPWDVILLMGGGFALAESFRATGLASWIGSKLVLLEFLPIVLLILAICLAVTFITEITSNTATAVVLMPILAASASVLGIHPYLLMIPATLSASFAFMLPVATPPNAIVFASGQVTVRDMARAGFALNILGAALITAFMFLWGRFVFSL